MGASGGPGRWAWRWRCGSEEFPELPTAPRNPPSSTLSPYLTVLLPSRRCASSSTTSPQRSRTWFPRRLAVSIAVTGRMHGRAEDLVGRRILRPPAARPELEAVDPDNVDGGGGRNAPGDCHGADGEPEPGKRQRDRGDGPPPACRGLGRRQGYEASHGLYATAKHRHLYSRSSRHMRKRAEALFAMLSSPSIVLHFLSGFRDALACISPGAGCNVSSVEPAPASPIARKKPRAARRPQNNDPGASSLPDLVAVDQQVVNLQVAVDRRRPVGGDDHVAGSPTAVFISAEA
jgi:hypothetical protein